MRLRRRLPRGLRPRLLLALLFTSLVTLSIAATVLLSPLPDRLREQSATNLRAAVLATRPAVEKAIHDQPKDEFALQQVSEELRQRTDGRVILFDPVLPGDVLYDTSTGASVRGATLTSLNSRTPIRTTSPLMFVVVVPVRWVCSEVSVAPRIDAPVLVS